MNLITFKALVDSTNPTLEHTTDLRTICNYAGISHAGTISRDEALSAVQNKIKNAVIAGHQSLGEQCIEWRRRLLLQNFLDNEPVEPYLGVIERVINALRDPETTSAAIECDWPTAIQACINLRVLQNYEYDRDLASRYAKDWHFAKAIQFLEKRRLLESRKPGEYPLNHDQDVALSKALEDMVQRFGGIQLARSIFKNLLHLFDPIQLRYHYVDRFAPSSATFPRIPFGYLLQLAAKYPHGRKPFQNSLKHLQEIFAVSQAYAGLYEVQPFSQYEAMFQDHLTLVPYLQRVSLRDTMFNLHQMRSSDVTRIIEGVLNGMIARSLLEETDLQFPRKILHVLKGVQLVACNRRGPVVFDLADVVQNCADIAPSEVKHILNEVFTHGPLGANSRFSRPLDMSNAELPPEQRMGADFSQRPLLSNGVDSYLMLEHAICAPAFIEAVLSQLRTNTSNLDEKVGHGVEVYVINLLKQHNIEAKFGNYKIDGAEGECDIVIETKTHVIFIETKKKSLTRAARAGQDASLLIDLAQSVLHAQLQAGWHEVRLRRHNEMTLMDKNDNILSVIKLNDRKVERIALSMNDYGGFQDRMLLGHLLTGQLRHSYHSTDPQFATKLTKVNAHIKELSQQNDEIYELDGRPENYRPFFNCWFLSLPHLLILLDGVSNSDEFQNSLWKTRHIFTGSQDFYSDHAYMNKIISNAASNAVVK